MPAQREPSIWQKNLCSYEAEQQQQPICQRTDAPQQRMAHEGSAQWCLDKGTSEAASEAASSSDTTQSRSPSAHPPALVSSSSSSRSALGPTHYQQSSSFSSKRTSSLRLLHSSVSNRSCPKHWQLTHLAVLFCLFVCFLLIFLECFIFTRDLFDITIDPFARSFVDCRNNLCYSV